MKKVSLQNYIKCRNFATIIFVIITSLEYMRQPLSYSVIVIRHYKSYFEAKMTVTLLISEQGKESNI
jgi:hypothetical protein